MGVACVSTLSESIIVVVVVGTLTMALTMSLVLLVLCCTCILIIRWYQVSRISNDGFIIRDAGCVARIVMVRRCREEHRDICMSEPDHPAMHLVD